MKKSVAFTLPCLCAISCADKFSAEELTIINGVVLGQSLDKVEENFKS